MSKKNSYAAQQQKAQQRKKTVSHCLLAVLCVGLLAGVIIAVSSCSGSTDIDMNATYYADITIKDYGTITVKLDQKAAPVTVDNFVSLAQSGFYDGLTFHRIIEGFMMQGGDPKGDGTGGSSQKIKGEFALNGHNNPISHKRGVISMARAQDYNSASSQFFIVHQNSEGSLDGKYAAFGHVVSGMEIVDKICETVPQGYNGAVAAADRPVIETIVIRTE